MHRCHIDTDRLLGESILLNREESQHIRTVLRLKEGSAVQLFDGCGHTRQAVIRSSGRNFLELEPCADPILHPKQTCDLTLLACISKGRRIDWTIEKAVEIGVSRIIPVISDRTIVRLDQTERIHKGARWQRVADDAARQCGSAWTARVDAPVDFNEALELCTRHEVIFAATLSEDAVPLKSALAAIQSPPASAGWFTGPEGDFSDGELVKLRNRNTVFVSLGTNILRAETAAVYGLCVMACEWL